MKELFFDDCLRKTSGNAAMAARAALEALAETGGRLVFSNRTYDFAAEGAFEAFCSISNNDRGHKRIALPVIGARDITLEGNGARLLMRDQVLPVFLEKSRNIRIRNLSVDFEKPFYLEGAVRSATANSVTLQIDRNRFPYILRDERLYYEGFNFRLGEVRNLLQYSPETLNLLPETADCWLKDSEYTARAVGEDTVELRLRDREFRYRFSPGSVLAFLYCKREIPGIAVSECGDTVFENVTVHHCEGMGFLFQFCRNAELIGCRAVPSRGRLISACADATHFVHCSGKIRVLRGEFRGQGDDAANFHGIYTKVVSMQENRVTLAFGHDQQYGVPLYAPGDRLRFVNRKTLKPYGECRVLTAEATGETAVCVTLDRLPQGIAPGDAAECVDKNPEEVLVSGCVTGGNRARSLLISCGGHVRVENNVLNSNGAAVWIAGDCNYWYESGPVDNVEICNNVIACRNRGLAEWGRSAVEICPELPQKNAEYHGRIAVYRNEFRSVSEPVVRALGVRDLEIFENVLCGGEPSEIARWEHCNVRIRDNRIRRES